MSTPVSAQTAGARSQLYSLLAAIFRCPLDAGQIKGLQNPEMLAALAATGIEPGEDFRNSDAESLRDLLAIDFTRVFHQPEGKIMPYEGLMLGHEDELKGARTEKVERFLAQVGYRVPPERGEMADHIAIELEFMADLARREAEALLAGKSEAARKACDIQKRFLDNHLGRWADIFAARVAERAETAFYQTLARAVGDFVRADLEGIAPDDGAAG